MSEPMAQTKQVKMEAKFLLATIAQQYQLRLAPDHLVVPQPLVSLRPKYGLPMTIHKR